MPCPYYYSEAVVKNGDWVVGEVKKCEDCPFAIGFSLVAEIGWLASSMSPNLKNSILKFQSRCRDWVVGEFWPPPAATWGFWRFSLVAEIGWLASLIH